MPHPEQRRKVTSTSCAASFALAAAFLALTFITAQMAHAQANYETRYPNIVGTDSGFPTASGTFSQWFLPIGDANGGITGRSHFQLQTTTMQGGSVTESLVFHGGIDSDTDQAGAPYGGITVGSANVSAGNGAFETIGGSAVIQGGDDFSEGTIQAMAGSLTIRPGAATSAYYGANSIPGHLVISQTFRIGSSYTYKDPFGFLAGKLGCIVGHNTIGDCAIAPRTTLLASSNLRSPIRHPAPTVMVDISRMPGMSQFKGM